MNPAIFLGDKTNNIQSFSEANSHDDYQKRESGKTNEPITTIVGNLSPSSFQFSKEDREIFLTESISLKIFEGYSVCPEPFIPFRVISYIASHHLEPFIKESMANILRKPVDCKIELLTSCVNTAYMTSRLFLGKLKCEKMMDRLRKNFAVDLQVLFESGNRWKYSIFGLFDGAIINKINQDKAFDRLSNQGQKQRIKSYGAPLIANFFKFTQPAVDRALTEKSEERIAQALTRTFSKLDYKFNLAPLNALRKEIAANNKKTNKETSFIYNIAIIDGEEETFQHVFILEQFFSPTANEAHFRIYQSWIWQTTLHGDMIKRRYGSEQETVWDEKGLNKFLDQLKDFCCVEKNDKQMYNNCFGYFNEHSKLVNFKNGILTGISLRYLSCEVKPTDCLKELAEMIDFNPSLFS